MYRKLVSVLLGLTMVGLAGCKRDAEINAVLADFDSFTKEMVQKVEAQPTSAGVDEAQKFLESKREDLTAKWNSIKGARSFQVSAETQQRMGESLEKNFKSVAALQMKHMSKSLSDTAFKSKLEKLLNDYKALYPM
ncbi:MAG: hypothetical protein WCF57_13330 [Pyrinomonadaceae bacterium]